MFNIRDLLRLSCVPGIGPLKLRQLVTHFGDPGAVLTASPRELVKVTGIEKKLASTIAHFKNGAEFVEDQLKRVNKAGARVVTLWDKEYPELLKRIYDPPPFLFVRGSLAADDKYALAIVGTRLPTTYGQKVAETIAAELTRLGMTVVSGLARGVDTVAHTTVLRLRGRTLAVIGSGLDVPYPPENTRLMERICDCGAVLSEFPMGTKPDAPNFPRRNRIISGLSLGTLVVESDEDGGAMITASTALDQNREVFAVPGNIFEKRSVGPNKLIRDGRAKLTLTVDDIIDELRQHLKPLLKEQQRGEATIELTLFERRVLDIVGETPLHVDAIAERSALSTSDTLVTLLTLEFKGLVKQLPGKFFLRM